MRARNLKPKLFLNETLGTADPLYTVIFEGTWCLADREGRLEDRPARIHAAVNPYRPLASTVEALDWLVQEAFLLRYTVRGARYLAVVSFSEHQQPHHREPESSLPPPPSPKVSNTSARRKPEASPGPARGQPGTSPIPAALTPDSGFRTPDSGLLTPSKTDPKMVSTLRDGHVGGAATPRQNAQNLRRVVKKLVAEKTVNGGHAPSAPAAATEASVDEKIRTLAQAGNRVGDIVKLLAQYHVTAEQVEGVLAT